MRETVAQAENEVSAARSLAKPNIVTPAAAPLQFDTAAVLLNLQRRHGNRYVQRLFRSLPLQAKLTVSQPTDLYELEADRVADQVMRSSSGMSEHPPRCYVQRACVSCQEELERKAYREEDVERAERDSASGLDLSAEWEPRIASLSGGGQPLSEGMRGYFEPLFGYDFSAVRTHTGSQAAETARALQARAYTVQADIAFDTGQYAPETLEGRHLLAHELTHVVQQGRATALRNETAPQLVSDDEGAVEVASAVKGTPVSPTSSQARGVQPQNVIQRRLLVGDPAGVPAGAPPGQTNETIINDYLATLCPDFVAASGAVEPVAGFCLPGSSASNPESFDCFCEMHSAPTDWTIVVDDNDWPHTDPTSQTVTVHSPFSGVDFGHWTAGPPAQRAPTPNWLVLGHELCGHARLMVQGTHPTGPPPTAGGRPSHDATVQIQNTIATEHGIPAAELRGLFADPHHGESFAAVTVAGFGFGSADVSGLPPNEQRKLDIAEAFIRSAPVKMDVTGHADKPAADTANNLNISSQRAEAVRGELEGRGIGSGRFLVVNGVGDSQCPLAGRQPSCRKVEIFMFVFEGASQSHP